MPLHVHHIGKISLNIDTGSLPAALRLRGRAEEMAWQRLPALIETVFDALAPAGVQIRIARLDLELDDIAAERLELDLPAALEHALRSALADAIEAATHHPSDAARALSLPAAMLEEFDLYLRNGALPFRSAEQVYDAAAMLTRLIELQPAALAALLRRRAGERHAIERLVLQAGEAHLSALLHVLSPADAAVILAYLTDFRRCHTDAAAVRLSEPELGHSLWIVTLKYLLHEAGTQFNRRRYLAALLAGVAAAEGLSYATLLALMQTVASRTRGHQPLAGSLLSTLDELLDELGGVVPQHLPAAAAGSAADELLTQLRSAAAHPVAMDLLVQPMTAPVFGGIIGQLQPQHGGVILAYLDDLTLLHQQQPALSLSVGRFEHQVRLIALRYLLREAGSQFNRISWLRRLLQGLAVRAGISYKKLLDTFHQALRRLRARQPLSSSLPEGLAVLAAELHTDDAATGHPAAMLADLQGLGSDHRALNARLEACSASQFNAMLAHSVPAHADIVATDLEQLSRLIAGWRQAPSAIHQLALRPLALRAVLDSAGEPFERRAWLRRLLQALADQAGLPASSLPAAIAAEAQRPGAVDTALSEALDGLFAAPSATPPAPQSAPLLHAEAAIALAEQYLRSGQPEQGGAQLSMLAAANPRGFSALLRRLLAAASGNTQALTERLLNWMLPEEIVASLLPGQQGQAALWAQVLAAQPGASTGSAWRQVLDAAWRGTPLAGPGSHAWPGARLDRAAMLRHWLDHGVLPWWADSSLHIDGLLADLDSYTEVALHQLLDDAHAERLSRRLRRLSPHLRPETADALMLALAPPSVPVALPAHPPADPDSPAATPAAAASDSANPARTAQDPALLLAWLAGNDTDPLAAPARRQLAQLLAAGGNALQTALRTGLAYPSARQRWLDQLPEELLARILHRLAPALADFILDLKQVLAAAWRRSGIAPPHSQLSHLLWQTIWALLADPAEASQRQVAAALLQQLPATPDHAKRILLQARRLASQGGYIHLTAVLRPPGASALQPIRPPAARQTAAAQDGDILYIGGAGVVLMHVFLPMLFNKLGLLSKDGDGRLGIHGSADASRAVHLLQYLVDGRCDAAEPELALSKLLCGLPPDTPVAAAIEPTDAECHTCEELLGAVIGNWPSIGNTSIAGLRETFLQRNGRLQCRDGKWTLTVPRKTVDVLLDQINWGYAVILHPWMEKELSVEW
ncbi:hypothetical protein KW842_02915 [Duganella sp. sic0402]|uniref:contractile injection system tape measure protein n=1 Tax=Duganella sp. sic0402 TaxID=2854786 RepID=UPI001C438FF4|nr:contractile injection system tape measure protein [Duganella sp. sic0402]MBV7534709.1 hypothetical protein [Duganella sp. sic0402]